MSISDEHDLQDRLDQAFQAITPRQAPLDQAVRQGRLIRVRRRLAAAAGLAVVAAGVAVPVLLHQQASQPVLNGPRHPAVTVYPAGPHAPAGLIASGTAGGRRWRLTASKPGPAGAAHGAQCFTVISLRNCGPVSGPRPSRSDPVSFTGTSDGFTDVQFGPVSSAVSYVTARLADGTVLTLHPVSVYGTRFVGYAVPRGVQVSSITAYSARGELASTIPFNAAGRDPGRRPVAAAGSDGNAPRHSSDRVGNAGRPRLVRRGLCGTVGRVPDNPRQRRPKQRL